jgi:hypothetical protein
MIDAALPGMIDETLRDHGQFARSSHPPPNLLVFSALVGYMARAHARCPMNPLPIRLHWRMRRPDRNPTGRTG